MLRRALFNDDFQRPHYFDDAVTKPDYDYSFDSLTCGRMIGRIIKINISPAKEIEIDRIELPTPPKFDPVPLLAIWEITY